MVGLAHADDDLAPGLAGDEAEDGHQESPLVGIEDDAGVDAVGVEQTEETLQVLGGPVRGQVGAVPRADVGVDGLENGNSSATFNAPTLTQPNLRPS
jgi:hypothetical protein